MATTIKRLNLSLTKEDIRELEFLTSHFGQTQNEVIRRALLLLYYITTKPDITLIEEKINEHK
jgi:hypothetical protein